MNYKIESNIPIPVSCGRGRGKSELRLTVEKMEIGNSIVIANEGRRGMYQIAQQVGIKIITRKISPDEFRVWRVEDKNEL